MMELGKFQKLKTYDLVVLDPAPKKVPVSRLESTRAAINKALKKGGDLTVDRLAGRYVVCRVEKPVSQTLPVDDEVYTITVTLRSIDKLDPASVIQFDLDGKPDQFRLTREFLAADGPNPLMSLEADEDNLDELAITNPLTLLKLCSWEWLPAHGAPGKLPVRDRLDLGTQEGITKEAMRAMVEYRAWITQRVFEQVAESAVEYARCKRTQYALEQGLSPEQAATFAAQALPCGGDIPGSTELSSDIDINTFGDGTEFAVQNFNALFRHMFDGNEPGIVFDVNMYGKDFLPKFTPKEAWTRKRLAGDAGVEPVRQIRPVFDHNFSTSEMEKRDALRQLMHGFVKLRRYMVDFVDDGLGGPPRHMGDRSAEESWNAFCDYFRNNPARGQDHPVLTLLTEARNQHLIWNDLVHRLASARNTAKEIHVGNAGAVTGDAALGYLRSERDILGVDRKRLMATQNSLYEHALRTHVESARLRLSLLQFKKSNPILNRAGLDDAIDEAFLQLRSEISSSLYFANEAYVSAGGVMQVVGGKQQKSRKVGTDYGQKQSFHNIAYTAHELMQSAVDQLADIHKEAHRHFHAVHGDLGGTLLSTGKYIHRLFNALKHLYTLMSRVRIEHAGAPGVRLPFTQTFPDRVVPNPGVWKRMRRFGYGLEGLKKAPADWPSDVARQAFVARWQDREKAKGTGLLFLLAVKFGLTQDQLRTCLDAHRGTPARTRKQDLVIWLINELGISVTIVRGDDAGSPLMLRAADDDHIEENYYRFFGTLVQCAIEDYYEYCAIGEDDLKKSLSRKRPPYYWEGPADAEAAYEDDWSELEDE